MFVPAATVIRQMRLSITVSVRFVFAEFVYIVRQRAVLICLEQLPAMCFAARVSVQFVSKARYTLPVSTAV